MTYFNSFFLILSQITSHQYYIDFILLQFIPDHNYININIKSKYPADNAIHPASSPYNPKHPHRSFPPPISIFHKIFYEHQLPFPEHLHTHKQSHCFSIVEQLLLHVIATGPEHIWNPFHLYYHPKMIPIILSIL